MFFFVLFFAFRISYKCFFCFFVFFGLRRNGTPPGAKNRLAYKLTSVYTLTFVYTFSFVYISFYWRCLAFAVYFSCGMCFKKISRLNVLFCMGIPGLLGVLLYMGAPGLQSALFVWHVLKKNFSAKCTFLHGCTWPCGCTFRVACA